MAGRQPLKLEKMVRIRPPHPSSFRWWGYQISRLAIWRILRGFSLDTEENESGQTGDTYYNTTYDMDTSGIEERLDTQQETLLGMQEDIQTFNNNFVGGVGVMIGLFGLVLGFNAAKELLKIWLH